MRTLPYEIVDVFTDRPFTGNPLAVVFDADDLDRGQLQAIAREFNLSETVFPMPPTPEGAAAGADYRARIFTPRAEIPFAGHPSVGVAVTQVRRGLLAAGLLRQECGAGVLPVQVSADGQATLTGGAPTVGPVLDPAPLLRAVGLSPADLDSYPARRAGAGLEFPFLPVKADAVARAKVPAGDSGVAEVYVLAWDPDQRAAHVRLFAPGLGVSEDPATGSAALALGVYLVESGLLPATGDSSYVIHQGAELHRPSVLTCTVSAVDGVITRTTVTGSVVAVARGEIAVPPFVG